MREAGLGHGAETATWRNFYLEGAAELRGNFAGRAVDMTNPEILMAVTVDQVFDSLAIRVNGPEAWDKNATIDWNFTDLKKEVRLRLENGVLTRSRPDNGSPAQLSLTLTKPQLFRMLATQSLDGGQAEGDQQALATLLGVLDSADPQFRIVIP